MLEIPIGNGILYSHTKTQIFKKIKLSTRLPLLNLDKYCMRIQNYQFLKNKTIAKASSADLGHSVASPDSSFFEPSFFLFANHFSSADQGLLGFLLLLLSTVP